MCDSSTAAPPQRLCVFSSATNAGAAKCIVRRPFEFLAQFVEVEFAVGGVANRRHHDSAERRRATRLIDVGMRLRAEQRLGAARAMRQHRGQIAHRAARHQHRRFLAQSVGGHPLEPVDGRILAVNVVAQFRARHRLAHLGGRQRDRVAAQIDHLRRPCLRVDSDVNERRNGNSYSGMIALTISSIARLLSSSSVSDQVTATVAARRGAIPWRISSPA